MFAFQLEGSLIRVSDPRHRMVFQVGRVVKSNMTGPIPILTAYFEATGDIVQLGGWQVEFLHVCQVPGCDAEVKPRHLMCASHWAIVPQKVQQALCEAYTKGQEMGFRMEGRVRVEVQPTRAWAEAAQEALAAVLRKERLMGRGVFTPLTEEERQMVRELNAKMGLESPESLDEAIQGEIATISSEDPSDSQAASRRVLQVFKGLGG